MLVAGQGVLSQDVGIEKLPIQVRFLAGFGDFQSICWCWRALFEGDHILMRLCKKTLERGCGVQVDKI
ncbi:hypothetical protein [Helicobacter mehlei]|uniref:hypothetical protein n=1 Tax=Helicobacter mehlei TaxID=2316080 RepID=UPI0013CDFA64|nr:hypothetical protein [Helicobacter mehlei]